MLRQRGPPAPRVFGGLFGGGKGGKDDDIEDGSGGGVSTTTTTVTTTSSASASSASSSSSSPAHPPSKLEQLVAKAKESAAANDGDEDDRSYKVVRGNRLYQVRIEEVEVAVERPMGLELVCKPDGTGVVVGGMTEGGNAAAGGLINVEDVIVAGSCGGERVAWPPGAKFDAAMDALAALPRDGPMVFTVEREVMEAADNQSAEEIRTVYWNAKRDDRLERWKRGETRNTTGVEPKGYTVKPGTMLGTGSFGQVFEGECEGVPVVLKRAKESVFGADELLEYELELSKDASDVAPEGVSGFIGLIEVGFKEEGQLYDGKLPTGTWGVWRLEGRESLLDALGQGDGKGERVAELTNTKGDEAATCVSVCAPLLKALAKLHDVGIVHRDIKPEHLIWSNERSCFVLIDFGAAARCLGEETINYFDDGVGPHDPSYTAIGDEALLPEGVLGGADAPPPTPELLTAAWDEHTPDRFDIYAVGATMAQMTIPKLRRGGTEAMLTFQEDLKTCEFDLMRYRDVFGIEAPALDANNGAGWEACAAMLAPRPKRPSGTKVLEMPFFKK